MTVIKDSKNIPSYKGHRKRLREKYKKTGFSSFEPHEVLELLLQFSIPRKDTKEIAHNLIKEFGSISNVFEADLHTLLKCKGIGEQSAIHLSVLNSLSRYCAMDKISKKVKILTSTDAGEYAIALLTGRLYETFYVVTLDSSKCVINAEIISEGGISEVYVNIRKILDTIVKHNAHSVLLIHNHPNNSLHPSVDDIAVTNTIVKMLEPIGIDVIDHIYLLP